MKKQINQNIEMCKYLKNYLRKVLLHNQKYSLTSHLNRFSSYRCTQSLLIKNDRENFTDFTA